MPNCRPNGKRVLSGVALACISAGLSACPSTSPPAGTVNQNGNQTGNQTGSAGQVSPSTERTGEVSYKLYLQPNASAANRKGIVMLGAGNNESDPSTGSLDGALENSVAAELAKLGYVSAVVAYRDQPAVNFQDGGTSWNRNTAMLATDMSNVANAIIAAQGNGLTRAKVLTGGVSYASYALLTNVAMNDSPLADTRGVLAACGSTGEFEAQNFKIPVFSLNCSGNPEGNLSGQALIDKIGNAQIKADSAFYTDAACNSHCGGNTTTWTNQLVGQTQKWLP